MVLQNETESVTLGVNNDDVTDSEVCRFIQYTEI